MVIKITEFAKRHFDKGFGGTKITNISPEEFEKSVNYSSGRIGETIEKLASINKEIEEFNARNSTSIIKKKRQKNIFLHNYDINVIDGYADFCKLVAIKNYTNARVGTTPITLENYQYIRSGYSARTEKELPIFSRFLEMPLPAPHAEWLILVLYHKEQLYKEHKESGDVFWEFDDVEIDWGIVSINAQSHPNEEPMKPETMIRNALGIKEGGSGVPLDKEKYLESVDFWSKNITVK